MKKLYLKTWISLCFAFIAIATQAQFTIELPYAASTVVTGINNDDNICGYYTDLDGITWGFFIIDGVLSEFQYTGYNTWLGGINNNNMIVGRYNPTGAVTDFHAFFLDPETFITTTIPDLDGYEFMSPNDINDNMQISGDVKTGVNRRFFLWDETNGLNTQNYLLGGSPAPTYGGHGLDNSGRVTGWYIDGADQVSFRYHPDFGYTEIVDLPDPLAPNSHKTRLMGTNSNGLGVLDFVLSDDCHIYDFNAVEAWTSNKKMIPGNLEIHMLDINDENHVVGSYVGADGVTRGYADLSIDTGFDMLTHGYAFENSEDPLWNWDFDSFPEYYLNDPFWPEYEIEFPT
ncbi:MAG: hypothetical protein HRT74_06130, partial [Flavobacteriales bacterium]|nr:hypothetical protein [Flavobacteriales bacterium]